jgi:glycolate oxidase iron-sulfur subunit
MDSPRGRIHLLRGLRDGEIALTPTVAQHFDRCLGCMACVPACPSGVRYDLLIERARVAVERGPRRGLADRAYRAGLFAVLPYPRRLRAVLAALWLYARTGLRRLVRKSGLLRRLPARLAQLEAVSPDVRWHDVVSSLPAHVPARGATRARVALVAGCVQGAFFPSVNEATLRVLSAEGCDVRVPRGQGCCGALSLHTGREAEAKAFARALIARFEREPADFVVVNAAGCGSHLKDCAALFAGEPDWAARAAVFAARVRDVNQLLAGLGPVAARHPVRARVAYHDACHLAHAQGVRSQPRDLLRAIPGLEVVSPVESDVCCGSAGIYNLVEPDTSDAVLERKLENIAASNAELIATGNPGCMMQLGAGLLRARSATTVVHPVELLDRSYATTVALSNGPGLLTNHE